MLYLGSYLIQFCSIELLHWVQLFARRASGKVSLHNRENNKKSRNVFVKKELFQREKKAAK